MTYIHNNVRGNFANIILIGFLVKKKKMWAGAKNIEINYNSLVCKLKKPEGKNVEYSFLTEAFCQRLMQISRERLSSLLKKYYGAKC